MHPSLPTMYSSILVSLPHFSLLWSFGSTEKRFQSIYSPLPSFQYITFHYCVFLRLSMAMISKNVWKNGGLKIFINVALFDNQDGSSTFVSSTKTLGDCLTKRTKVKLRFQNVDINGVLALTALSKEQWTRKGNVFAFLSLLFSAILLMRS